MKCPLLNKECITDKCAWWYEVVMEKKTESDPKKWVEKSCVVLRIPPILIEIAGRTNQVAATIESERNEFVKGADLSNRILAGMAEVAIRRNEALEAPERKELPNADPA